MGKASFFTSRSYKTHLSPKLGEIFLFWGEVQISELESSYSNHKLHFRPFMHKLYARLGDKSVTICTLTAVLELTHGTYMVSASLLIRLWFEFDFLQFAAGIWKHVILFV